MDILYYFDPVDFSKYYDQGQLSWRYSLGSIIEKNTGSLLARKNKKLQLAIIGIPFDSRKEDSHNNKTPGKIRSEIYQLAKFNKKIGIVDFGNLKPASSINGNYKAVRDIIDYLNELNITTMVIGGSQDLSYGVCSAFKGKKYFSFSTIDAFLDVKTGKDRFDATNYLSRIFTNSPDLFQFNLIAYQSHYVPTESLKKIKPVSTHLRLGALRDDINLAEPVLRNTDFLSIDVKSIKTADAPGNGITIPNGLQSQEICQLARFAGLSNRLKVFGIFNLWEENDINDLTIKLFAQILWYFIDGFTNREDEFTDTQGDNTVFKVEIEGIDKPLVFIKQNSSNRWWIQIETAGKKKLNIACSEKEYQQASSNEIPQLWINFIQKIDQVLK